MIALIGRFEEQTGRQVDLSVGATGSLAVQIDHGAPADLFFSADRSTVQRLAASGRVVPESIRDFASGELVIVWRDDLPAPSSINDLAAQRFATVATANPETAPYGAAANQALQSAGVWNALGPRIVRGESVAQTYQLVRSGNVDAALVARSLLGAAETRYLIVDPVLHDPIVHTLGIVADGRREDAQRFVDFVLSADGMTILARHGFHPAPEAR